MEIAEQADKTSTAYREAGRGVIAYRLGLSLFDGEWADGSTDREQVIVLLAGNAAEKRYNPATDASELQPDSSELHDTANELVSENWQAIEAVATALLEYKSFSDDGWTIIIDAIDDDEDWREMFRRYLATAPKN